MLNALKEDDMRTESQVHALAFAIGQVVALEATSTLKLKGRDYSSINKHESLSQKARLIKQSGHRKK